MDCQMCDVKIQVCRFWSIGAHILPEHNWLMLHRWLIAVTHVQETSTRNLHRIECICSVQISGTRNFQTRPTSQTAQLLSRAWCKILVQVSSACVTPIFVKGCQAFVPCTTLHFAYRSFFAVDVSYPGLFVQFLFVLFVLWTIRTFVPFFSCHVRQLIGLFVNNQYGVWLITASTTSTALAEQIALYSHTTVKKITLLIEYNICWCN